MITIQLIIDGKQQSFTARGVTLRRSYEAYELYREYELAGGNYPPELMERCEDFVCACFGGAFTREQLLDGYQGTAYRLYPNMLNAVVGYTNDLIVNFPDPAKEVAAETPTT